MEEELVNANFMDLLKRAGKRQRDVARLLDVRESTVSDWARSKHMPKLSPGQTLKLIHFLGCSLDELAEAFPEGGDHVDA